MTSPTSRPNTFLGRFWREAAIAVAIVATLIAGVVTTRSAPDPGVQPALAPAQPLATPIVPGLTNLHRESVKTPIALDFVTIDGAPTAVRALTKGRILRVERDDSVGFVGWAFDRSARPAAAVFVRVGKTAIRAIYGTARPDVAKVFGSVSLANTGFSAQLPARSLPRGLLGVTIAVVAADATSYWETQTYFTLDTR